MATTTRPEKQTAQTAPPSAMPASDVESAVTPPAPRARRFIILTVVAVLVIAGLFWGFRALSYNRSHESTDDAQVDGHLVPVLAKVGGYVARVNGEENQHVKEGDTIVVIDDAEYKARLAQANANLAAAQAASGYRGQTGQALAEVHTAEGQDAAAAAQIAAAQANADKAASDLKRTKQLADQQIVSRQQLDAAQAASDAARATLLAAQKQAAATGATVTNAEAGVRLAGARLASAQAQQQDAVLQEMYTRITAPVAGFLSRKQVEVGQLVQPGQTLFTIVADTGMWVTANYKETQLNTIRVGQPVVFDVDSYGGKNFNGVVESIAAATGAKFALLPPDNATGNFTKVVQRIPIRIRPTDPPNPAQALRPGMSVNTHIATR